MKNRNAYSVFHSFIELFVCFFLREKKNQAMFLIEFSGQTINFGGITPVVSATETNILGFIFWPQCWACLN